MRNNSSTIYKVCLLVGDAIFLIAGLSFAYILRVSLSHEVLNTYVTSRQFLGFLFILLPFWLAIFALLGLYNEKFYNNRFSESSRLLLGGFIGILFAISYSYIFNVTIFPARLVAIYGFLFSFLSVLFFRTIAKSVQRYLYSYNIGINTALIIGNNETTKSLIHALNPTANTGYKIAGIVGDKDFKTNLKFYKSFKSAMDSLDKNSLHTIIQTELFANPKDNDEILTFAQENHIAYRFVPGNSELFTGNINVDLLYSVPVIAVEQTALIGWGRVVKRVMDILFGLALSLLSLPFMIIIAVIIKLTDHKGPILFKPKRLTRYGEKTAIYKFRTIKQAYNGLSPEEAFEKMGKPNLIEVYRENGDQLDKDPRFTKFGRLLRKTSLDEIPQFLNVLKGDISLVGPRAIEAYEMDQYNKKNLILAVKSGLTGLAQISGRRDISFEERRRLDLYYVQNWTFFGDLVILARTITVVLFHKGAK